MKRTIIVDASQETSCPKCNHTFPLSDGISRQTIERYAEEFEQAFEERRKQLEVELAAEAKRHAERAAAQQVTLLREQLAAAEAAAKASRSQLDKVREEARVAAKEQYENDLKSLQEAVSATKGALADSRNGELELRRQLREAEEERNRQRVEYERKLDVDRKAIEERARASAVEEFGRREAQLRAQMESAQREAADLKRKLEQGSQQTQGEAMELGLEAMLRSAFPLDEFVPVPKGVSGADLLQRVRSQAELEAEKAAMTRIWKKRETQLARMSGGVLGVVGELQGFGQDALPQLEEIAALPNLQEAEGLEVPADAA